MKKIIILLFTSIAYLTAIAQDFNLDGYPPVWDGKSFYNSMSFLFPFKNTKTFFEAGIYFERKENSNFVIMRYRVFPNYSIEELYMKDTPKMLVKLGDGTILTGKKERVTHGLLNAQFVIDIYFNLDNKLQQKILRYGIEKARIAYVYLYLGVKKNQIFDAYTKDSEMTVITAQMLLKQIQKVDFEKAKRDAKKRSLEYGF